MISLKHWTIAAFCAAAPLPATAANDDAFVEANLLSILYHELGHAIIDIMALPVFGQEEDAADVASVLLIHDLFEEDAAIAIAYDAAFGFLGEAAAQGDAEPAYWDTHGPDLQRYYNLVCLFAGGNMDGREDVAEELGLPDDRLIGCEEEFDLAYDSWGPVFDEMAESAPGQSIVYRGGRATLTEQLVAEEVEALNADFVLPAQLTVTVEDCGEANAFYDPNTREIIMCAEFEDWVRDLPLE